MTVIRNTAAAALAALVALIVSLSVIVWDDRIVMTPVNTVAVATFTVAVLASFVAVFGIMVTAHDARHDS